jgi:hypothetical protein
VIDTTSDVKELRKDATYLEKLSNAEYERLPRDPTECGPILKFDKIELMWWEKSSFRHKRQCGKRYGYGFEVASEI